MEALKKIYRTVLPKGIRQPIRQFRLEREFHLDSEIEFYGGYNILRKHNDFPYIPYPKRNKINWAHGWYSDFFFEAGEHPYFATCNIAAESPGVINLVTRNSQEKYLHRIGYPNSLAIGLPLVYIPKVKMNRRNRSLLVMPGHSLENVKIETFEEAYVSLIDGYKKHFDLISVCVHPSCYRNGYWIDTFKKHGYPIIRGFEISNVRSFYQMQRLFSTFEFVTTNIYGSHLMYSQYFGAKTSVIGPEPQIDKSQYLNHPDWIHHDPGPMEKINNIVTLENYRKHYPELFVSHPTEAICSDEKAKMELGFYDKKPGKYMFEFIKEYISV